MKRNVILLTMIIVLPVFSEREKPQYKQQGAVDALGPFPRNSEILLVQLDLPSDSLIAVISDIFPVIDLNTGAGSYQRIMTDEQFQRIKETISDDFIRLITENYKIQNSRESWGQTLVGSMAAGTDGEVGYTCYCLDSDGCLVVGFNDDWWDPFDYYGDAYWSFITPEWETISTVRISICGMQCDDLPLWESSSVSIKRTDCSWADSDWYAMLSLDYTTNIFELPANLFYEIWCDGNLMPVIWSEDNYSVEWVAVELYYEISCNSPEEVYNFSASDGEHCDFVFLSWDATENAQNYRVFRDGNQIVETNEIYYEDIEVLPWIETEYCIQAYNECGESEIVCETGFRIDLAEDVQHLLASNGEFEDKIIVEWDDIEEETGYKIYRDDVWIYSLPTNAEYYEDSNISMEQIYEYCVVAFNSCGNSNGACDEGYASVNEIPNEELGDINADGIHDVLDIIRLALIVLDSGFEPTEYELWACDINEDGVVNIQDIVYLVQIVLEG